MLTREQLFELRVSTLDLNYWNACDKHIQVTKIV